MLDILSTNAGKIAINLLDISERADKVYSAEYNGSGHSSSTQQQN